MVLPHAEIVQRAERLAARLNGGRVRVKKNALQAVVADFMSNPRPDRKELREMLRLLEKGSGGHLQRTGGYGDQVRIAIEEIGRELDRGDLNEKELKTLFGWTARLLLVRSGGTISSGAGPISHQESDPRQEHRGPRAGEPRRSEDRRPKASTPRPSAPSGKLGTIGGKGMKTLELLKQQLEANKRDDKK